jgi:hypothetical protein
MCRGLFGRYCIFRVGGNVQGNRAACGGVLCHALSNRVTSCHAVLCRAVQTVACMALLVLDAKRLAQSRMECLPS